MLCSRTDCPIERTRKNMAAYRAEQIAKGFAKTNSTNDYHQSCALCGNLKSWRTNAAGEDRAITQRYDNDEPSSAAHQRALNPLR